MWLGSMIRDPEDLALMLSMALGLAPASVHLIPFFFPPPLHLEERFLKWVV